MKNRRNIINNNTYLHITLIILLCSAIEPFLFIVSFNQWNGVCAGCSGSVRVEYAIEKRSPSVRVRSDDVLMLSYGLGGVAAGRAFPLRFPGSF